MNVPVIFVHGIFQMLGDLPAAARSARRPILFPDLLGYGAHAHTPPAKISLQEQADHIASVLQANGSGRAHIIGHSIGGATAMIFARRYPQRVASCINIEGNFTLADAFWTSKLAGMSLLEIEDMLRSYESDAEGWLRRGGIEPSPATIAAAIQGFRAQPPSTLMAMSQSVVETTSKASYMEDVNAVLDSGISVHLFAGERSRSGWNVPEAVWQRAASRTVQPGVGHMMMLEAPEEFLALVDKLIV